MPRILADSFTRADAATLGANWTLGSGFSSHLGILSNGVKHAAGDSTDATECYTAATVSAVQFSQAVLGTIPSHTEAVVVRCDTVGTPQNLYAGGNTLRFVVNSGRYRIWRVLAGVETSLALHGSQDAVAGDVVRLEITLDNTLTLFVNGVRLLSVMDSNLTTGYPGLQARHNNSTDVLFTGWSGGSLGALTQHGLSATPVDPYGILSGRALAGVILTPESLVLTETHHRMAGHLLKSGSPLAYDVLTLASSLFLPAHRRTQHGLSATPTRLYGDFSGRISGTTPTTIHETLSFIETLRRVTRRRTVVEAPALVEVLPRQTTPVVRRETLSFAEVLVPRLAEQVTRQGLSATPTRLYGTFGNRLTNKSWAITESLLMGDALVRQTSPTMITAALALTESALQALRVKLETIPGESLTLAETLTRRVAHGLVETLVLTEFLSRLKAAPNFAEALTLSDDIASQLLAPQGPPETVVLTESLVITPTVHGPVTIPKAVSDTLTFGVEGLVERFPMKALAESLAFTEVGPTAIVVRLVTLAADALTFAETLQPFALKSRAETLALSEVLQKRLTKPTMAEVLILTEHPLVQAPFIVQGITSAPWRFDDLSVGNLLAEGSLSLPQLPGPLDPTIENDKKIYVFTGDGSLIFHVGTVRYKITTELF